MRKSAMFRIRHHGQVLKAIISTVAVKVVDYVPRRDRPIGLFPNKSVKLEGLTTELHNAIPELIDEAPNPGMMIWSNGMLLPAGLAADSPTRLPAIKTTSAPSRWCPSFLFVLLSLSSLIGTLRLAVVELPTLCIGLSRRLGGSQSFRVLESKPTSTTANTLRRLATVCTRNLGDRHGYIVAEFVRGRILKWSEVIPSA